MIGAVEKHGIRLAINWPLAWYPPHVTTKRLIDEGAIGDVAEVHFYDGNRGPLYHLADKLEVSEEEVRRSKPTSWWYKTASGGGSLLDYLGYGATLGTWYKNGEAVSANPIGSVTGVHVAIHWDHTWIAGTPFAEMEYVILDDFAIHWFDFLVSIIGNRAEMVFATASSAEDQTIRSPLLSQVLVTYSGGQASLSFDANASHGASDTTTVIGTHGTLRSTGPDLGRQNVALYTAGGWARPVLTGRWFNDGFAGTMGALLRAIENGKEPIISARGNLAVLCLCQAAIESARSGAPVRLR
jgi:predicted dehydrogenase